jgi:hypothetical protein
VATQRLIVATLAGEAAVTVIELFERWRAAPDAAAVDHFCAALRENGLSLPVVYFSEWVDRWLMGHLVPGPNAVEGRRYQTTCMLPNQAMAWADQCGDQFPEQKWLVARLCEAAAGWGTVAERYAVVVIREVVGGSTTDEEIEASLGGVPEWLSAAASQELP